MDFFRSLISDVLSEPAVLVGLVALIDLIAQRKLVIEYIKGTAEAIMGFVILGVETDLVVSLLGDFANILQHASDTQGIIPNNEAIVSVVQKGFGKEMAMIIFFAMAINIMITRFTPWKFIFLTSRHTLFMSIVVAVVLATADMTDVMPIAVGSLVVGMTAVFFPTIAHPYMKRVAGSDDVTIGHFSALSYVLASFIGSKFGDKEYSTEDMSVPKSLLFLHDMPVVISFTMSIIFLVMYLFADADTVKEPSGDKNWFMFSIIQSITFVASVHITLQGVCMVVMEVAPTFKGISDKLASNARPALDCPVTFPYASNAVLVGFLSSLAASLIGTFTLYLLNMTMITPGTVPRFFVDVTVGIFGNTVGGRRGVTLGASAQGLLVTLLPVFLLPVLDDIGFANTTLSDADFGVLGTLLGTIAR